MPESTSESRMCTLRLILGPAVITLAVTILRLVGELQHWSKLWFNPAAGGLGAIIGIVWLVPIFGVYFALKLAGTGAGPTSKLKAVGGAAVGFVLAFAGMFVAYAPSAKIPAQQPVGYLMMALGVVAVFWAWPAFAKTLLAYAYAARLPVAILMFFAIRGNWGTHYDAPPPGLPPLDFWPKYLQIALLPQLVLWVVFTVVVGALCGGVVNALARRTKPTPAAGA